MSDIMRLSDIIRLNVFPFSYDPEQWVDVVELTNCYAYALNCPCASSYYLGMFSGHERDISDSAHDPEKMLKLLFEDLASLGLRIQESSLDEAIPEKAYKICFLAKWDDYHFFRRDQDGFWSHKRGWLNSPTNKHLNEIITNPAEAKVDYSIVGYYIISKLF